MAQTWPVSRARRASLRQRCFDVTVDARMDISANLLAALSGARNRIGYDIGGSGWLLTETLQGNRDATHRISAQSLHEWLSRPESRTFRIVSAEVT
jgi:hypothetical protein